MVDDYLLAANSNQRRRRHPNNKAQGDRLHTGALAVELESIEEAYPLEAYNRVVAEWHTYFVGPTWILIDDNAPREPTDSTVTGMAAAEVEKQ